MTNEAKATIMGLGFCDMGDHFSQLRDGEQITVTERCVGRDVFLEVLVQTKTRRLTSDEKESLARIAVTDREHRLESINIGEQTSILLSILVSVDELPFFEERIKDACNYLNAIIDRVECEPSLHIAI